MRSALALSIFRKINIFRKNSGRAMNEFSDDAPAKPLTRSSLVAEQRKKFLNLTQDEKRKLYKCKDNFVQLDAVVLWPAYAKTKHLTPRNPLYKANSALNKKIGVFYGDITSLEIDAIVNAANESLLGGGGVDGAIHRAAGSELKTECASLKGCLTGDAVVTLGYRLPAKYVIHTVGPVGEKPPLLKSCYLTCLDLAFENNIRSIAFPCISTGIFGYSNAKAAPVVLKTVREWLNKEENAEAIDRIIFCVFLQEDTAIYDRELPNYFPLA